MHTAAHFSEQPPGLTRPLSNQFNSSESINCCSPTMTLRYLPRRSLSAFKVRYPARFARFRFHVNKLHAVYCAVFNYSIGIEMGCIHHYFCLNYCNLHTIRSWLRFKTYTYKKNCSSTILVYEWTNRNNKKKNENMLVCTYI